MGSEKQQMLTGYAIINHLRSLGENFMETHLVKYQHRIEQYIEETGREHPGRGRMMWMVCLCVFTIVTILRMSITRWSHAASYAPLWSTYWTVWPIKKNIVLTLQTLPKVTSSPADKYFQTDSWNVFHWKIQKSTATWKV